MYVELIRLVLLGGIEIGVISGLLGCDAGL